MINVNYVSVNIAEAKTDAIVNSLGIHTNEYGKICQSIVDAADSDELRRIISNKQGEVTYGSIFETKGYALPTKRIVHVVTPEKHFDPNNERLRKTINDIFYYCVKHGIKSVTIAPIGTGANGYSKNDAFSSMSKEAFAFSRSNPDCDLDVYITFFGSLKEGERRESRREPFHADRLFDNSYRSSDESRENDYSEDVMVLSHGQPKKRRSSKEPFGREKFSFVVNEAPSSPSIKELMGGEEVRRRPIVMKPDYQVHNLSDYVNTYIGLNQKYNDVDAESQRENLEMFLGFTVDTDTDHATQKKKGKKVLNNYKAGYAKKPSNKTLFIIALALRMTMKEAIQLFTYHRSALSPIDKEDLFFLDWLDWVQDELHRNDEDMINLWTDLIEDYQKQLGTPLYPLTNGARKNKF